MRLLCSYVAATFLLVLPVVFFFAMLLDATRCSAYVQTGLALCIAAYTLQAIKVNRQCIQRWFARFRLDHIGFDEGDVAKAMESLGYVVLFLSGKTAVLFP